MNKKIIAIAIAAAMTAPVAMADVKVSGVMAGNMTATDVTGDKKFDMGDAGLARIIFDGSAGNAFARFSYKEGLAGYIGKTDTTTSVRQKYAGYKIAAVKGDVRFGLVNSASK